MDFYGFGLSTEVLRGVKYLGYERPTEVQLVTIPRVLSGSDLIVQAHTGTGKTSAFGIPLVEIVNGERKATQALVLVPTRELAKQVGDELRRLGKFKGLRVITIYGGTSVLKQIDSLNRGAHIVVGTPGRVKDLLNRGALNFRDTKTLILDEGDRMLDMGFIEDVISITRTIRTDRQTLMFSATFNEEIIRIAETFLKHDYKVIRIKAEERTLQNITQKVYRIAEKERFAKLIKILKTLSDTKTIVFTSTKNEVETLTKELGRAGLHVRGLHGDYSQRLRETILREFRQGDFNILVATDVASRGLDIRDVELVINYRLPRDSNIYIHRIGRTGRAGRSGIAISLVSSDEKKYLYTLQKKLKKNLEIGLEL